MTPRHIEIVVKGEVGDRLDAELPDGAVTVTEGATSVRLAIRDASELYAVLDRLRALGFDLLAVHEPGREQ